eukprot:Awhi_evm1s9728
MSISQALSKKVAKLYKGFCRKASQMYKAWHRVFLNIFGSRKKKTEINCLACAIGFNNVLPDITDDVQEVNRDMQEIDEDDVSDIDLSCLVNGYGVKIDVRQLVGLGTDVELIAEDLFKPNLIWYVAVHFIYGSGANATVFGGTFLNQPAAIKVFKRQSEELEHCEAEAKYLRQFK